MLATLLCHAAAAAAALSLPRRCPPPRALLGDSYYIESPCSSATAALLTMKGVVQPPSDDEHWVALHPIAPIDPSASPFTFDASAPPTSARTPAAVGRLRLTESGGVIDSLRCSLPKEDPLVASLHGAVIDALLAEWVARLASETATPRPFEALAASASVFTKGHFSAAGFAELDAPDLTALGRGQPILTHRARLPSVILALQARLARTDDALTPEDRAAGDALLEALRGQAPPEPEAPAGAAEAPAAGASGAPPVSGGSASRDDPWADMRKRAGF